MSLAELPNYDDRRSAIPEFDRTPPQDLVAEQSVLGGMLLSKDAIGDVFNIGNNEEINIKTLNKNIKNDITNII